LIYREKSSPNQGTALYIYIFFFSFKKIAKIAPIYINDGRIIGLGNIAFVHLSDS
jgi:hypothetical protein